MEDEIQSGINPLAIASVALAVLGGVVYCCGSFLCIGWLGIFVWLLGALLGGIAIVQAGDGTSKALAGVGIALNLLFLLAMGGLMLLGIGASVMSELGK